MTTLVEVREEIAAKSAFLAGVLDVAGPTRDFSLVKQLGDGDTQAKVDEFRRLHKELTELGKKRDELQEWENDAAQIKATHDDSAKPRQGFRFPSSKTEIEAVAEKKAETQPERKSPGTAFTESPEYKGWNAKSGGRAFGQSAAVELPGTEFKTTFTTTAASLTAYDRVPGIVMLGQQKLTIRDLLSSGTTTMNTIRYVVEDTYTNAATAVTEGATKPEAAWDLSEVDSAVRKIAVTSKVTDELFADFSALRAYIDERMRFMVAQTEEALLINGNGTPPNLRGILQTSGIQTQARGSDPAPDAVYKAMVKIMTVGFFQPDGVVMHPLNWQSIRLLTTADGIYLWGSPADSGPERLWSLPVVVTTGITQNTALVGAFKLGAQVFFREGLRVETTNSNEDDFKTNLIAIRMEQREALCVYRPKAFCTVTSMP